MTNAFKPTMIAVTEELNAMSPLRGVVARPQKMTFVGDRLYWLQGATQELFSVLVDPVTGAQIGEPSRVIVLDNVPERNETAGGDQSGKVLTKEEELLRERQRAQTDGITSFTVRKDDGTVFYQSNMTLFVYSPTHKKVVSVFESITDEALRSVLRQKPSLNIQPIAGDDSLTSYVFVNDANLYRMNIVESGDEQQCWHLSATVTAVTTLGRELSEFGTADYIMQEEFDRYSGHTARGKYVLFLHTDTSMLNLVQLPTDGGENAFEELPFPRVGDPNALSAVAVFDCDTNAFSALPHCLLRSAVAKEWGCDNADVEYITRFGFVNAHEIYVQVLDRRQERMAIVTCRIADLPCVGEAMIPRSCTDFHQSEWEISSLRVIRSQCLTWAWVEVTNALLFSNDGHHAVIGGHSNDEQGYFHLLQCGELASGEWRPLTSGNWNVKASSVQRIKDSFFFEANIADRLGNELYVTSAADNGNGASPKRLTLIDEHVHSFAIHSNGELVAVVSSTAKSIAALHIISASRQEIRSSICTMWAPPQVSACVDSAVVPKVVTYTNSRGVPISGLVFFPEECSTPNSVPLMMYVYGGPHVQLVYRNLRESACNVVVQSLVKHGVAVAIVDNQMSNANSLRHHSVCKKNMGRFEAEEYVTFKESLCREYAALSPSRVGVFGWSYGGYATLLCMSQAAEAFKVGFAGAPVGDWRLYDTGYTERYMGLLHDPEEAYAKGTVASFAKGFPDELDRLFIAHGLLDENVHFSHSCDVVNALVACSKPYHMLVYPGERHGLRKKKASRMHYDAQLIMNILCRL